MITVNNHHHHNNTTPATKQALSTAKSADTQRLLIFQDRKALKSSKQPTLNKGGPGFGNRKALKEITNKSSLPREASSKKKNFPKEELNIAQEMVLHSHKKCIEAQVAAMRPPFWDPVLPGYDSVSSVEFPESRPAKTDIDSPHCYPKPVELSMSEFSDMLVLSTNWDSPQSSPLHQDSQPSSPFAWEFEPVEFLLKQEDC
ncbi:protein PATRONUS 2-like [Cornus florida]|uniref:protein PATRONUS 2-like n=1 Tax=Cornus florida TaxID=4283 RepID=UPI0028966679|nr:protein PATRONUS 2-like [Cornus florida]